MSSPYVRIKLNRDYAEKLDQLVATGFAPNRGEAVKRIIDEFLDPSIIKIRMMKGLGNFAYMNGKRYCAQCHLAFKVIKPEGAKITRCPFCNMPLRTVPKYDKTYYIAKRIVVEEAEAPEARR